LLLLNTPESHFKQKNDVKTIKISKTNFLPKTEIPNGINNKDNDETLKKSDWYNEAMKDIEKSEYQIQKAEGTAYTAPNRKHDFRGIFSERGLTIKERQKDTWQLNFSLEGVYASENKVLSVDGACVQKIEDNNLIVGYEGWKTEYINNEEGIRQNFIIEEKLEASEISVKMRLNEEFKAHQVHAQELHLAKDGENKVIYKDLKVWDGAGKTLESYFKLSDGGQEIDIVVEAKDAVYPITIDPLSTTANWTAESNQVSALFGSSVSSAGDVNGDGYSDVIVGAPNFDNGQTDEGRVFVYHGSATGLSATANWTTESNQASAQFGKSVSSAGDVNGDGYSDVIVGAPNFDNGQTDEGRVFVYHGSASGLSTTANWTVESNQANAYFGTSVAFAGDVNGDGYSDVLVGSPNFDNGQTDEGRAFVYHGSATGLSTTANWAVESNQASANFGVSVSSAGDINGDGYSDVIVGSPNFDNGETNEGRTFLYHGSATGLATTANWTVESNQALASFGWSVASAGDVNGDGYSDVIVGAFFFDNGESNEGRAFIYHGSATGLSATANWTAESNQANAFFGRHVAPAGDVNGDGYSDVIVGAYAFDNEQTDEGQAFVYHGSATGLNATANWTTESNQASAFFGVSVASAGDVNGDGYSDVIVGASSFDNGQTDEGRVFVYYGKPAGLANTVDWTTESNQASASFGSSVSSAGDVNGDGYSDVIVGASNFDNGETDEGRAFVYHGSATGLSITPNWTAESNQTFAYFGESVSSAGDVNGDGYSDVIVGASRLSNGQGSEGRAFVYHGSATGLSATANWTAESNQVAGYLGSSVSSAGDVNGDGYSDVVVGANGFDNGETDEGRVFVYYGSATGLNATANWTTESNQASAEFGYSVSSAGDVNGDGYSDVIIGAYRFDNGQSDEGRAFVYHGSATGLSATANWTAESNQVNGQLGSSVSSAGDVNGDGYSDVIVTTEGVALYYGSATGLSNTANWTVSESAFRVSSAGDVNGDGYSDVILGYYFFTNGETNEGKTFVYHGSATGLSVTANWTAESNQVSARFGWSVSSAGDVNGDGYSDVIIGSVAFDNGQSDEGRAFVYYGNEGKHLRNNVSLYNNILVSNRITQANVTGSTFATGLFVKSFLGRNKGKLVWETKAKGQAFSSAGSSLANSTQFTNKQASFIVINTTGTELKSTVDKPSSQTKVRARVEYSKATAITGQIYGPWRYPADYLQGNRSHTATPLFPTSSSRMALVAEQPQTTIQEELNVENKEGVKIYPNPAQNDVYIDFGDSQTGKSLKILDIRGRVVFETQSQERNLKIDCSKFSKGIYFLKTEQQTYKIVIE